MRKFSCVNSIGGAVLALAAFLSTIVLSADFARAQGVFCPGMVPAPFPAYSVSNITQLSGNCTNPHIAGAASGAALASQAIGDMLGSSANEETSVAARAIEGRRETPPATCPTGQVPVDGICRARPQAAAGIAPGLASTLSATPALPGTQRCDGSGFRFPGYLR